jgi:hypothetical protein
MPFMNEMDAISGKHAKAFITINGQVEELFYARSLEATIEKNKTDVPVVGKTNVGQKAVGWTGTGTLNIYYVTSLFRRLVRDYIKTGRDFYFDLTVSNEDPTSAAGRQTVVLKNCNLDSVIAAQFDATSDDPLNEDISFTFDDYDMLEQFAPLN